MTITPSRPTNQGLTAGEHAQATAADKIHVEKITPLSTGGNLKAFVAVRFGSITIHDFRIVQQPGQEPWVSVPQREVNKNGERKWFPLVNLPDELKKIVSDKALEAWRNAQ